MLWACLRQLRNFTTCASFSLPRLLNTYQFKLTSFIYFLYTFMYIMIMTCSFLINWGASSQLQQCSWQKDKIKRFCLPDWLFSNFCSTFLPEWLTLLQEVFSNNQRDGMLFENMSCNTKLIAPYGQLELRHCCSLLVTSSPYFGKIFNIIVFL